MRMVAVRLLFLLLSLSTLASAAPKKKSRGISDIDDSISRSVILSKFATLVNASGLGTFMSSRGPFTLFVPTNSAFSKLPPGMYEDLLRPENQTQLQRVVLFHLINQKAWGSKDLKTVIKLTTCEGNPLFIKTTKGGAIFLYAGDDFKHVSQHPGYATHILRADDHCANGTIHQIDTLLLPPQLVIQAATADATTNAAPVPAAPDMTSPTGATPNAPAPVKETPADPSDTNVPPVPPMQQ